jgi:hypothetical protein
MKIMQKMRFSVVFLHNPEIHVTGRSHTTLDDREFTCTSCHTPQECNLNTHPLKEPQISYFMFPSYPCILTTDCDIKCNRLPYEKQIHFIMSSSLFVSDSKYFTFQKYGQISLVLLAFQILVSI